MDGQRMDQITRALARGATRRGAVKVSRSRSVSPPRVSRTRRRQRRAPGAPARIPVAPPATPPRSATTTAERSCTIDEARSRASSTRRPAALPPRTSATTPSRLSRRGIRQRSRSSQLPSRRAQAARTARSRRFGSGALRRTCIAQLLAEQWPDAARDAGCIHTRSRSLHYASADRWVSMPNGARGSFSRGRSSVEAGPTPAPWRSAPIGGIHRSGGNGSGRRRREETAGTSRIIGAYPPPALIARLVATGVPAIAPCVRHNERPPRFRIGGVQLPPR